MASHEDMIKIVTAGVNNFAKAESAMEEATNSLTALEKDFHDAGLAGMETMGKTIKTIHRLRLLKGDIAKVSAEIYALHDVGTALAQRNGADVALPTDGFTVFPLGGGGR